ncbi:MAG: Coenzyme F420 hydrogenase/dehydrogenase, beta subunit C-terminal domain [Desulfobacteraceae bacterium]|nr:Coenzyme F420 hydrogenase/dehydrogenase, beta subunit C-terminal domain [Desulfobacteraceae bacterium]
MAMSVKLKVEDQNPVEALKGFLRVLLQKNGVSAVLVPEHLQMKRAIMPALVADPEKLEGADPLAPAFPLNGAKILSRLSRKPSGAVTAAVLRPCEIRAFVELVKLKQGSLDEVLLIGMDCLGTFGNTDYAKFADSFENGASTLQFYRMASGKAAWSGPEISPACKSCEHPVPEAADVVIGFLGQDMNESFSLIANSERGEKALALLELAQSAVPGERISAVERLIKERIDYRDRMFDATGAAVSDVEKLMGYLANCVNCYNCRVACPVCYCRECVFTTDVFDHEPVQYFRWAKRKGAIKMPTDTVFYHLTRMAHMSTACIGCGQCSNACPNGVPVMELFRTIAHATQSAFDYTPGLSPEDDPPLSVFREREFSEVTGGKI